MTITLEKEKTVLNTFIAELRDHDIQKDSMRFRRNLERAGEIMAYELSRKLNYVQRQVETPLGMAEMWLPEEKIVIVSILRAGVPFHQGFLNFFDRAESGFVSAYRKYGKDGAFKVKVEYISCSDLTDKTLILVDPMLATGTSLVLTYNALVEHNGQPKTTHVAAIVASEEGVEYTRRHMPKNTTVWCGAVDQELTVKSYIVPGIGDAGDLAFGEKL
ncbi:uracil phosphoribosyltransferase [Bacteroidia bacterium]|nr:uracil phosphoribosyltransferase [Bacteroidia bacterium]